MNEDPRHTNAALVAFLVIMTAGLVWAAVLVISHTHLY